MERKIPPLLTYIFSLAIIAIGFTSQLLLREYLGVVHFLLLLPSVLIVALLFGFLPGLLSTFIVSICSIYFFLPPLHSFHLSQSEYLRVLVFIILGTSISWLMTRGKRAEKNLTVALKDLSNFKYALDTASIVSTTDHRGIITDVNDKFCEISKYSREELLGKSHNIVTSGFHSAEFFENLWETISKGQTWQDQIKNKAKDGSCFWVSMVIVPFLNSRGKPYQFVAIQTDITLRKSVDAQLRHQSELTRTITDNAASCLFMMDAHGHPTFMNPAAEKVTGYTLSEIQNRPLFDTLCGNSPFPFENSYFGEEETYFGFAPGASQEATFFHKNNAPFDVSYSISPIEREESQFAGAVLEFRDITQEKMSLEAVRIANENTERSLSQLEVILENMSEGLSIFDKNKRLIRMNSVALALHGYKDNETVIEDFIHFNTYFSFYDLEGNSLHEEDYPHMRAFRGEKFSSYELKIVCHRSAKEFIASYGGALARSKSGAIILAFVTVRDITDQKHVEQVLKNAVEARDTFMSIASHELKTPLTSLKLQTQMRHRRFEKQDPAMLTKEAFKKMYEIDARQVERLTRLVDDMLDISRINTGKLVLDFETFDLCKLTTEVLERFMPQFLLAECEILLTTEVDSLVGQWDLYRIEQVISNLFTNAMRYGAKKPIHIILRKTKDRAIIDIIDHGIGIAPEDQGRIFQQFERAVSPNIVSGLGLGLYIVSQIVKAHGGYVRLESRLGEGSKFSLELPLRGKNDVTPPTLSLTNLR